jgi:alkanesulfonate monooxygenase SsuD/methylene tetrahydromethanopterin reductase-like flavin-dependent oxidoreductase (luciferase family)
MIRSNLWALPTLVTDRTSRIAVGSGVAIPALSMAPVIATAIATINAMAPSRTFLGFGPAMSGCGRWDAGTLGRWDAGTNADGDSGL